MEVSTGIFGHAFANSCNLDEMAHQDFHYLLPRFIFSTRIKL